MFHIWALSTIGTLLLLGAFFLVDSVTFTVTSAALGLLIGLLGVLTKEKGLRQLFEWVYRFCFVAMYIGTSWMISETTAPFALAGYVIFIGGILIHFIQVRFMFLRRKHDQSFSTAAGIISVPIFGPILGLVMYALLPRKPSA